MYWLPFYLSLAHTFLHLTDIHLDLEYSVGSPSQCLRYCEHFLGGNCSEGKAIELVKDIYLG